MSRFHNQPAGQLADDYGALKAQHDAIGEMLDAMKAEFKARRLERVEGAKFTVTISQSARVTYDDKAIRAALGADICKTYERQTETTTIRVKPTAIFAGLAAE